MQLHTIDTKFFKLDGGAMFGVVPRSIWSRMLEPDSKGRCTWAMRCLLIEHGNRLILIDTGLGDKQTEKFFSYIEPFGDTNLKKSIESKGYSLEDVTDVILTHLHFDHVGGAVYRDTSGKLKPTFKNAIYWSHSSHWDWAMNPNPREKASFLKENFEPLQVNNQIKFIDQADFNLPEIDFIVSNGHTEAQIIPTIHYKNKTIVYCADLMPSVHHIPLPYVMSYDVRPLVTMNERTNLYKNALDNEWILFYEHDAVNECSTLKQTDKGVRVGQIFSLNDI